MHSVAVLKVTKFHKYHYTIYKNQNVYKTFYNLKKALWTVLCNLNIVYIKQLQKAEKIIKL